MEITPEIEKKCEEIIARYPQKKSAAMMILHFIQEKYGYFTDDTIRFAADKLGVRPIEVYGMVSFYPMYTQTPRGHVHIKVCRTLSCAMTGSVKLGHELAKLLNCPIGQTRGIYTLEFVECLGNCVKGPNVQVNDRLFENVAPEDAEKFVEKISAMNSDGALIAEPSDSAPAGDGDFNSPAYKG